MAASARGVFAIGVNCCAPADVLPAVRLATSVAGLPAVAYPNGGADWDATTPGGRPHLRRGWRTRLGTPALPTSAAAAGGRG